MQDVYFISFSWDSRRDLLGSLRSRFNARESLEELKNEKRKGKEEREFKGVSLLSENKVISLLKELLKIERNDRRREKKKTTLVEINLKFQFSSLFVLFRVVLLL